VEEGMQAKILQLLDLIAVEVAANRTETAKLGADLRAELRGEASTLRNGTAELRAEMRHGFGRVERRLGNLETRVEGIETELRSFRGEFERRIAPLER
jgi:hypothetical protein